MLPKQSFLKPSSARNFFPGIFILLFTVLVFYFDILSEEKIPFHIFYFPSILLMTWYFGNRTGALMSGLVALMWFMAERDVGHFRNAQTFLLNGTVYLVTFAVVFLLASRIRKKNVQLEKTSAELSRSNLELEQFAAKAAHDLQSPLATILGYTELIKEKYEKTGDQETLGFSDHVIQGVKRMSVFIKSLLNYSTVAKPGIPAPPVELGKIVKEVLEDLHFAILQKKAEITLGPLPTLAINAGLAGLLFQNLINNAMKYCEKEPRIHVSAVRQAKEWLFSIRDNGIGIPEESRERIFIMFEKLPTRQQYPGSGIGLATCQKIVERYGGRIWVESPSKDGSVPGGAAGNPGEGSTFFFTLPAA